MFEIDNMSVKKAKYINKGVGDGGGVECYRDLLKNKNIVNCILGGSNSLKQDYDSGKLDTLIVSGSVSGMSVALSMGYEAEEKPDALVDLVNFLLEVVEKPNEEVDLVNFYLESGYSNKYGETVYLFLDYNIGVREIMFRVLDDASLSLIKEKHNIWKNLSENGEVADLLCKKVKEVIDWVVRASPENLCCVDYYFIREGVVRAGNSGSKYYTGWCNGMTYYDAIGFNLRHCDEGDYALVVVEE